MPKLNRRALLSAAPGLLFSATGRSTTAADMDALTAWMRLAGARDDRLVIWWLDGVRYGVNKQQSRPLHGMQVGIFQRYFPQADGQWKIAMFELTYYTDLDTGELLQSWGNPYTGATNTVRHVRLGPEVRLQTRTGQQADPDEKTCPPTTLPWRSRFTPNSSAIRCRRWRGRCRKFWLPPRPQQLALLMQMHYNACNSSRGITPCSFPSALPLPRPATACGHPTCRNVASRTATAIVR